MKRFLTIFAAVMLLAASIATPAAAEGCGDTYTVQHLDNLSKIAVQCGTTVADILARNPQITNPNLIFTGQVLRLTGSVPRNTNYPRTYTVQAGDTLAGIASKFSVTVDAIKAANPAIAKSGTVTVGQVVYIPARRVLPPSSSSSSSAYFGGAYVTVSDRSVREGDTVKVTVGGFPPNSFVDYRVGEEGEDYSVVYDGVIDEDGFGEMTITIPSAADRGEYWVVVVTTTSHKDGVAVTSATIYIEG